MEYTVHSVEELEQILNKRHAEHCTVFLQAGRYPITKTLEIGSNLSLKAQGDVFFDGGILLDKHLAQPYKNNILRIDLAPYGLSLGEYGNRGFRRAYVNAPNELFVDGEAYTVARYPKKNRIPYEEGDILEEGSIPRKEDYTMKNAVIRIRDERIKAWENAKDAYLGGFPKILWGDECVKIANIDTRTQTVTTSQPHLYGYGAVPSKDSGWYVVNLLEELTEPGEYFVDRHANMLYFIPKKADFDVLQLSVLDEVMLAIEDACSVSVEGITFENTRNTAIYIEGGENVHIKNCVFRNLGIMAVQIGQGTQPLSYGKTDCHGKWAEGCGAPQPASRMMGSWQEYLYEYAAWDNHGGKNHLIEGCKIFSTGAGGILLSGGERKTLVPGNNTVFNCEFYDLNRLNKMYTPAVHLMGVGNSIRNCEMYDLQAMAILLHGNDHLLEYNKIHHVCLDVTDMGAVYMGRDPSEQGNMIRYNFIYSVHNTKKRNSGICAIYFDDGAIYNAVYGNVFYDIVSEGSCFIPTVYHNSGGLSSIANNLFIDCRPGLNPNIQCNQHKKMHEDELFIKRVHTCNETDISGVDITAPVYRKRYPYLYKTYADNYNPGTKFWNNHFYTGYESYEKLFVDPAKLDFTLMDTTEFLITPTDDYIISDDVMGIVEQARPREKIDFKKIGLIE